MVSSEYTKLLAGGNSGQKEALKGDRLHRGAECAFQYDEEAFRSTTYYGISERDVCLNSVWRFCICIKKGLCKTVTCELIKSWRPFSSWMAFPLWHERGSLEAPSRRWPWRLRKCSPSDQTGLFSGVRTTLESAAIGRSCFVTVDQCFNRPH